jgi:hypothetical protein
MLRSTITFTLLGICVFAASCQSAGSVVAFRNRFTTTDCSGTWNQLDERYCIRNDDYSGYKYSCDDNGVATRTNWTSYDQGTCSGSIIGSVVITPTTCLRDPSSGLSFQLVCGLPQLAAPSSVSYHSNGNCGGTKTSINAKCFNENVSGSGSYWYELGCDRNRPAVYRHFNQFCNGSLPQGPSWSEYVEHRWSALNFGDLTFSCL